MRTILSALALAAASPAAAEPVALLCNGSGISTNSTMNQDLTWTHDRVARSFSFEVLLDAEAGSVALDGKPMHIWSISEDQVVFYGIRRGLMGSLLSGGEPYKISRITGAFTSERGSGSCTPRPVGERLF